MKRKLLSIAAALLFVAGAKAQTSYGLKAGVNFAKLIAKGGNITTISNNATNFYVTGYADVPLANSFSIQPGVSLQGKGGKDFDDTKLNLMYIEVPVNFVYSTPTGNSGNIFLGAGPYAGFGIHAKASKGNYSESGSFGDAGIKTFDAGLNLLGGYKLTNGFLINVGYGIGLTNMYKDIDGVTAKNRVFSVGVGYQF
ncbi:porin family protein [uncultured Sphingobacterium sp.]|uniref:porin family protein n=1 Tax=uncultured Sphingobacterium sp. TaxID=182688 RepID=UPI0025F5C4F7|nr:porin family protein [uncultured Sphingobacterium sp.]